MSFESDLKLLGLSAKESRKIIAKQRAAVRRLKLIRKFNDKQARKLLISQYKKNGNKWTSKAARIQFSKLMDSRWKIHEQLVRFKGEKKNPEFDSP